MSVPPSTPVTRTLIAQAQAGDQAAFAQLYRRFVPQVRGLAALRLGRALADFVAVEDVVQETLAEAFTRLDRFAVEQADASFSCWLARLVEREFLIVHRLGPGLRYGYELFYDGGGQDGRPFVNGLTPVEAQELTLLLNHRYFPEADEEVE